MVYTNWSNYYYLITTALLPNFLGTDKAQTDIYTTIPIQSSSLFLYSGGTLLDSFTVAGNVKSRDIWTEICNAPSEIVYNSTLSTPNLAIIVNLLPAANMKISVVGRRLDANNYIAASFDYALNKVLLTEVIDGIENVLGSANFTFKSRENLIAQLWMFEEQLYVWCNDAILLYNSSTSFLTQTGFAINAITIAGGTLCILGSIGVTSLREQPLPSLEGDDTFLPLILRKAVQEYSYPNVKNWNNYKLAFNYSRWQKNTWYIDRLWRDSGYPALPPSTEEFFNIP